MRLPASNCSAQITHGLRTAIRSRLRLRLLIVRPAFFLGCPYPLAGGNRKPTTLAGRSAARSGGGNPGGFIRVEEVAGGRQAIPRRRIQNLLQFSSTGTPGHRVRIQGEVTLARPKGPTYIQDSSGSMMIRSHKLSAARVGDLVDVAGFPFLGDSTQCFKMQT